MQSAPEGVQASSMSPEPIFIMPYNFASTVVRHSPKFQLRRLLHACIYSFKATKEFLVIRDLKVNLASPYLLQMLMFLLPHIQSLRIRPPRLAAQLMAIQNPQ